MKTAHAALGALNADAAAVLSTMLLVMARPSVVPGMSAVLAS